jgi:HEAT repeat protein/lysophospholipase L1-like esterase
VRGRLVGNLSLSLVSVTVLLALLEGGARLVETRRPPRPEVADYIWDWDEKMPGGFYVMESEAVGWPPWEEFNRDGLRDRTRPHDKPEGALRIAVLGDSVTLGDGLRAEEAYPQVLEARLRARGRRIEVMNVALWGWSTRQERTAWERIARRYRPDQAILAVCLNDIPEIFNNLRRPSPWLARLHGRSALVRLVVNAQGREIDRVERLFAEPDARRSREALAAFFEEVRALRGEVEGDGAAFAVIVFPFRFQVEPGAPAPSVQREIEAFCRRESLRCLDLLPTFNAAGPSAFSDYDHLSAAGASRVADVLLESDLLPRGRAYGEVLEAYASGLVGRDDTRDAARRVPRAVLAWAREVASGAPAGTSFLAGRRSEAPAADDVVAGLRAALEASSAEVRAAAAWGLGVVLPVRTGPRPDRGRVVDALAARLGEADAGVRLEAAEALGRLGPEARGAAPRLNAMLQDPRECVRYAAAHALWRIGTTPEELGTLVEALQNPDGYVRAFAAWSLGNLGPSAGPAVPALVATLSQEETDVVAAAALARIGAAAHEAVPALVGALRHADAGRRWRAARTLGRIGPAAAAGVPALEDALEDPSDVVRLHAARALGRIGLAARPAAGALQRATGDPDVNVRGEARRALERIH